MPRELVLLGGGHAHMVTLSRLGRFRELGFGVTVVQPSEHHYYSGMGPGMLSRIYAPEEIRFRTKAIVEGQGGRFVNDRAERIDPGEKQVRLASGETLDYDVLSCNVGSFVDSPLTDADGNVFSVKPIASLLQAQKRALEVVRQGRTDFAIVGGGPAALEIGGNLRGLLSGEVSQDRYRIRIFAGRSFLKRLPEAVRSRARRRLGRLGIEVVEAGYVQELSGGSLRMADGSEYPADMVLLATGVKPSRLFVDSGLAVGPDGGLAVNRFLQHVEHSDIFGGGDCIHFQEQPLDKVGVYAVRQNPVLADNLLASLQNRELAPFDPSGGYMLIYNLGDGSGILHKGRLTMNGRPAFWVKDRIDRKFMRRFQALEP